MTTQPGPLFIPPQVCSAVGQDPASTPVDACMNLLVSELRSDGVSAPPADAALRPGLASVVSDAKAEGITLELVVVDANPVIDTPLRDIATEVGRAYPGSTVLVLSPSYAGTYSATFDRVTLEAGQDIAKVSGDPVTASRAFLTELTTPHFAWTPFTILLVAGVAGAAVLTRFLQLKTKKSNIRDHSVTNSSPADPTGTPIR